ncbi:MAG: DUF839 domain-containing protein [Gammaproteobacteria bacterium]|nr:DUF839 domain-containing protein [Gammaproteobacteria bacterium]
MESNVPLSRRHWLAQTGLLCSASLLSLPLFATSGERHATGPFGPLGEPDEYGLRLPPGFRARLVARTGDRLPGSGYVWHAAPDGGATFRAPDGGWFYVSNAEIAEGGGGAACLGFAADGELRDAWRILDGTHRNCAGGPTPWGTWLSGEEVEHGLIHECDPTRPGQGIPRPLLGSFMHEAAAVDPATGFVYLTEDHVEGRFYRFRPKTAGRLDAGVLEAAHLGANGVVGWHAVSHTSACRSPGTTAFARGEGIWYAEGRIYFSTTHDHRIWCHQPATGALTVIYDGVALGEAAILRWPDNLTVHPQTGALFVAEDGDDMQLNMLSSNGTGWRVSPLLQFVGHDASEVTGPAFSPDGTRLYLSSQRGRDGATGMTFEISGPFTQA